MNDLLLYIHTYIHTYIQTYIHITGHITVIQSFSQSIYQSFSHSVSQFISHSVIQSINLSVIQSFSQFRCPAKLPPPPPLPHHCPLHRQSVRRGPVPRPPPSATRSVSLIVEVA